MAGPSTSSGSVRALQMELKSLQKEPVEGFRVSLREDTNLHEWEVALFGAPGTLYEGGYFKALLRFPQDYPYSPPSMRFTSKVWHPNVYENGDLCISILHPPIDDPQSGELPCERWNPTQSVRTILLSVISLLNEPNTSSPANVDASVVYRRWKESGGKDDEYAAIVRKQVDTSRADADRDGVTVPTTVEDYCLPATSAAADDALGEDDDYDFYDYGPDDSDDPEDELPDADEDSGQGES